MIVPDKRAALLLVVPATLSALTVIWDTLIIPILVLDGLCVAILAADFVSVPRRHSFSIDRELTGPFAIGRYYPVTLVVTNHCTRAIEVAVTDDCPASGTTRHLPVQCQLAHGGRYACDYELAINTRGQHRLEFAYIRVQSVLGCWQRFLTYPRPESVTVYPDVRKITEYLELTGRRQATMLGIRQMQRIGGDNEFERLKEYHTDDEYRHIAWKATARQQKLISRAFQVNENQSAIFMLDCGRMMTGKVDGRSSLDYALDAMLMLSYVALSHHDSVGVLTFAEHVDSYLPPKSGHQQINRIMQATYHRHPREHASNFAEALSYVNQRRRRRTLLVLLTQVIDDTTFTTLKRHLTILRTRHLPVLVLLRDHAVEQIADGHDSETANNRYTQAAAAEFLTWRRTRIEELRAAGVLCLDVVPKTLTPELINQYLHIKARHLL